MTKSKLRQLLEASPSLSTLFRDLVVDAIPWIFQGNREAYDEWRIDASAAAGLPVDSIYLVGSAAVGYSLSPYKAGRAFRPVVIGKTYASDIDIAIIDSSLFTASWNDIVRNDRRRALSKIVAEAGYNGTLSDTMAKIRLDIYHGAVIDIYAPPGSELAARLRTLFAATTRRSPFRGHRPRARLYRRHEDFLDYHEQSLRQLLLALNN